MEQKRGEQLSELINTLTSKTILEQPKDILDFICAQLTEEQKKNRINKSRRDFIDKDILDCISDLVETVIQIMSLVDFPVDAIHKTLVINILLHNTNYMGIWELSDPSNPPAPVYKLRHALKTDVELKPLDGNYVTRMIKEFYEAVFMKSRHIGETIYVNVYKKVCAVLQSYEVHKISEPVYKTVESLVRRYCDRRELRKIKIKEKLKCFDRGEVYCECLQRDEHSDDLLEASDILGSLTRNVAQDDIISTAKYLDPRIPLDSPLPPRNTINENWIRFQDL